MNESVNVELIEGNECMCYHCIFLNEVVLVLITHSSDMTVRKEKHWKWFAITEMN